MRLMSLFFVLLLALWLLLTSGDLSSLLVGLPFIMLALWSYRLQRHVPYPLTFSFLGALRFVVFFLLESFRGGLDIALRVWQPRVSLSVAFYEYRLIFPQGPIRSFFMYCISLLPGTVSVCVSENGKLCLHVLDDRGAVAEDLARLERRVCDLFALPCYKGAL